MSMPSCTRKCKEFKGCSRENFCTIKELNTGDCTPKAIEKACREQRKEKKDECLRECRKAGCSAGFETVMNAHGKATCNRCPDNHRIAEYGAECVIDSCADGYEADSMLADGPITSCIWSPEICKSECIPFTKCSRENFCTNKKLNTGDCTPRAIEKACKEQRKEKNDECQKKCKHEPKVYQSPSHRIGVQKTGDNTSKLAGVGLGAVAVAAAAAFVVGALVTMMTLTRNRRSAAAKSLHEDAVDNNDYAHASL